MKFPENFSEVGRKGRPKREPTSVPGMGDREPPRMEKNPIGGERRGFFLGVKGIPYKRMPDVAKVNPDLMRPSR